MLGLFVVAAAVLACSSAALATSLTAGDVVIYRVGSGSEPLTSSATSVYLDEYAPNGNLVLSIPLPTVTNGANKPLVATGSATSEGLLTLSENDAYLMLVGYDAAVGTKTVAETKATTDPRTVGRVSGSGEVNTETALTAFANENNARSATSTEGKKIWVGGAEKGKSSTGGVQFTELGKSTSVQLNETDIDVRQVSVVDGQLYVSADPTKTGELTVATVGTGEPTTAKQTITNLPFETKPEEPYAYSLLTLGTGSAPDTAYVADNKLGEIVKYSLNATTKKWVQSGSVEAPYVTGVTANDVDGIVTIYGTSTGSTGREGILYKITDVSGYGGTLEGVPEEIAEASLNEAFRGVAFAPGTTIGSGGTPPPAPTITPAENYLAAAIGDPTNQSLPITVGDANYKASELTVTVHSSNKVVAPESAISISGSGSSRTLSVSPQAVGESRLIVTVEAPNGAATSTQVTYGASENLGSTARYYEGEGGIGASAIEVGEGYMIIPGAEDNILRLYHERTSSEPVKTYNFDSQLPFGAGVVDIKAAARAGNTIYWVGNMGNSRKGVPEPDHDVVFAATITGSGANTELTYLGSYTHLREDLINWDDENGKTLGFGESAEEGVPDDLPSGFRINGLEFASGSSTEAFLAFRAPLEPLEGPEARDRALIVPITNFSSLVTDGNPGSTHAAFGTPLQWNFGGLVVRGIRKTADNEYIVIAGTSNPSDSSFGLYAWNGETELEPVLLNTPIASVDEGAWESILLPETIRNGSAIELIETSDETTWYNGKDADNGLQLPLEKNLGNLFTVEIPAPATLGAPYLKSGANPTDSGLFTLAWKPSETLRPVFKLEHENAKGGWSIVASGLTKHEYAFQAGSPEQEGTWNYRVSEANETAETEPSTASEAIKVDFTPPETPTASASRSPDYAGDGGWYKSSVTVSFTAHSDPPLADGSPGSGVEASSLTAPETLETDGSHKACGTVADKAGNVSKEGCLTVQVEATPPSLEITCPATALINEANVNATVTASDAYSGLASNPSGSVPIRTSATGPQTVTRTAVSNVGLEATKSCTTDVVYPTPGAPAITVGATPNNTGLFTLGWSGDDPMQYVGLTYTLQAHDAASSEWTTVASGIEALSYEFSGAGEKEGTWVYRVQASDSSQDQTTAYSAASAPVVVDETPPYTPNYKASRAPDYSGDGGWYKNSVKVTFTANGDPPLTDGSPGSGVNPETLTAPETFNTSGQHVASGTVADKAGNVSQAANLVVQVEATPPNLEVSCPATAIVGEADVDATVTASDDYSGLATNPSGSVPIDTSRVGPQTVTRTAVSNVDLEATKSCTTEIVYPTPGAPTLTAGATPNDNGLFTLGWSGDDPAQNSGLTYTLQAHNAASETWKTVASGIEALSYTFSGAGEKEGTWVYRVEGYDNTHEEPTEYSAVSAPVVVDKTAPNPPSGKASRPPDYSGGGGWYLNTVTVSFTANGDPPLSDGSPGSGANAETLTAPETFETSGSHDACGTVADNAGNVSKQGCLTVQVEATPPNLVITCPATAMVGQANVTATVTASDAYSGLASNPSGSVPINTSAVGPQTVTRTAVSNVGLEATESCTTEIVAPPEFGRCIVDGEVVGKKTVNHGTYTTAACVTVSKGRPGHYEWESGVLKAHFSSSAAAKVVLETIRGKKVTCTGDASSGEYSGEKTVAGVVIEFSGCELSSIQCTSAHAAAGTITTEPLEGVLGIYQEASSPAKDKIGLDLYPNGHSGPFMSFSCGSTTLSLKGSVIVQIGTNAMHPALALHAEAKKSVQEPESFVKGAKDVLEASDNGGGEEAIGLTAAISPESGEDIELNSVV